MFRQNFVGIQMLRKLIRDHIFKNTNKGLPPNEKLQTKVTNHLKKFNIPYNKIQSVDSVDIDLPPLKGDTIADHFKNIANEQISPFVNMANLMSGTALPKKPEKWIMKEGWIKYDAITKTGSSVDYPNEEVLVIDVETFVPTGGHPLMVTAVSPSGWYSWCSKYLLDGHSISGTPNLSDLIKVSDKTQLKKKALLIGHNISFDRSFMKEQYLIEPSKTNFLDTMSMHIAIGGFTSYQRLLFVADKKNREKGKPIDKSAQSMQSWMSKSCLNNLNDVYQFHCKKKPLDKKTRNIFVEGTIDEIKNNFQDLMTYCADDVCATYDVFKVLWPTFKERFPHPVTLGGMFEMGKAYLPVNKSWFDYMEKSDNKFHKLEMEGTDLLQKLAEEAKLKSKDESYKNDAWLWDLDWSKKSKKLKKIEVPKVGKVIKMTDPLPKWYMELCDVDENNNLLLNKLSLQKRIAVKLLRMVWNGFPLHHSQLHGWGYLVPFANDVTPEMLGRCSEESAKLFPLRTLNDFCKSTQPELVLKLHDEYNKSFEMERDMLDDIDMMWDTSDVDLKDMKKGRTDAKDLPILNVVPGCYFYKLPRKDGDGKNIGNPLSKNFHNDIDRGTLSSLLGKSVESILKQGSISSYWKNNVKRIRSQYAVGLNHDDLPDDIKSEEGYNPEKYYGAILPRIVTAGTVTRRAVEPTWLTASNAYANRIGSELKSMVQSPPGYSFVGADVDSQELWIAAVLGDSYFAGEHGCTAFGWMTLQGTKAEGTDMHSRVADMLGISREHSKIFNYGRIYGAGVKFAEQMLLKFNPQLSPDDAKERATKMFQSTKGKKARGYYLEDGSYAQGGWQDGSESFMFNKLEMIANTKFPKTPVLKASMSRALEPASVGKDFMTSRVNWVVQSSAVDYLHLMLVCMRWLFEEYNIGGRFCISIHDEVRYLVPDKDKYRAALALQVTNLFTRSMFAHELKFDDLPQSVAFFSSVEIDRCLRKDALNDCVTPSNQKGLLEEYGIPKGESLTIDDILEKTSGKLDDNDEGEEKHASL